MSRNFAPLAARSCQPDEGVEDRTGVPWGTPTLLPLLLNAQNRLKTLPERVIDFPDGWRLIDLLLMMLRRCQGSTLALSG